MIWFEGEYILFLERFEVIVVSGSYMGKLVLPSTRKLVFSTSLVVDRLQNRRLQLFANLI